ncbi:acyl-CoA dehydrogenase family protein [Paenibacillus popilliae]|nr:acyl-CoA dehydrogenase family protein [Paenibacillus sp. SDF0028]
MESLSKNTAEKWIEISKQASREIGVYTNKVDEGKSPKESLDILRQAGLMGITIPETYGGEGISLDTISLICKNISKSCLSTGMTYAMHVQQLYIISEFAKQSLKEKLLPRIAKDNLYIVSVTSKLDVNNTDYAIERVSDLGEASLEFRRHAPTVTGVSFGDIYLILMTINNVPTFVVADGRQINNKILPTWEAMGMRGTQSCEVTIQGNVPIDHVLDSVDYGQIGNKIMNPIGHILWAYCWLGAVESEYKKLVKAIRNPEYRYKFKLDSDLLAHQLGEVRCKLDAVDGYLCHFMDYYKRESQNQLNHSLTYKIKVNNVKIISSEILCKVMDMLVQIGGLKLGYLKNKETSIEKIYRDIRSSRLMLSNEKLKIINGKMSLIE